MRVLVLADTPELEPVAVQPIVTVPLIEILHWDAKRNSIGASEAVVTSVLQCLPNLTASKSPVITM